MFLSKFKLAADHPQIRQGLINAHDMHRNILKLFDTQRKDNNVLYSLNHADGVCDLYLQSDVQPVLDARVLTRHGMSMEYSVSQDKKRQKMNAGSTHSFILDAMPCKAAVHGDPSVRGKRQCLETPESRLQWLERKGEQGGFKILSAKEHPMERINVLRRGVSYFLPRYRYTGELLVTDETLFRETLRNGIGPGKSYGFGLLLVA